MVGVKTMLAVVLLGLCVLMGLAHGFVVEKQAGTDNGWQFSVKGGVAVDPVFADAHDGGRLVDGLKGFQVSDFGSYDSRVAGSGDANVNQFADNTFTDLPEQFSSDDFNYANQFQEEQGQYDTQRSSSSGDAAYVYNARLQSSGVPGVDALPDAAYDYNKVSTLAQGSDTAGSQFDHLSSFSSYALGDPLQREQKAPPSYVYDASFTTTDVQQQGAGDQVVPVQGHQGPVSYYTPSSDRDGAFVFYDPRSDDQKKTSDDDSAVAASFASSDGTAASASTEPILTSQHTRQGTHGCPNSYWAQHVKQWPAPLKITTPVSQAFGGHAVKVIYGTTTLFQALLDTRDDCYSKLLRHGVAALLNSHAKSAFPLRPAQVVKLFKAALASRTAAAAQAQKFENLNNAFGDKECQ